MYKCMGECLHVLCGGVTPVEQVVRESVTNVSKTVKNKI